MHKNQRLFLYLIGITVFLIILISLFSEPVETRTTNKQLQPQQPANPYYTRVVGKGESLYQLLVEEGVNNNDVYDLTWELGQYVDMSSIQIGDTLKVMFYPDTLGYNGPKRLKELVYKPDMITSHVLYNSSNEVDSLNLTYKKQLLPVEFRRNLFKGVLHDNLNNSLLDMGFDPALKQEVNNALESEVSFVTDARNGDEFSVYVEERWYKGQKLPRGKLLYCSYNGVRAKFHEAFRFADTDEASALNGMYTPKGKTLVQNSVRAPLNSMHITSPFGRRIHPIRHTVHNHSGIDLRAARGTAVYAVASGKVISAGYNGGYGKEVRIKHATMITNYAHLSRIYVRKGQRVTKGTKIGAVGSTGVSTGPHLHFGLMQHGRWINPKRLKMVGAIQLSKQKLAEFKTQMQALRQELEQATAIRPDES